MDESMEEPAKEIKLVMPPDAIPLTNDEGLYKVVLQPGTSDQQPTKGSRATVHYTGTLEDGTEFDSSVNRGEKFSFNIGKGEVIKAWDIGVVTMKKNEKCEIVAAPKYGYGAKGSPPKIPGNAVLKFVIELFDWEGEDLSEDSDKGLTRKLIVEGSGYSSPNDGALVNVKMVGKYQGKTFDSRDLEFNVSEVDDELELIPAINRTVKHMKQGEHCEITVQPHYGYGAQGCEKYGIPTNAELVYELTLSKFEKATESWEMTDDERIENSKIVKEKGTQFLKEGKISKACLQYGKILDYLGFHDAKPDGSDEEKEILRKSGELKLAGLLNLTLCYIKLGDYSKAIDKCREVLKLDPNNEKALYRMADAHHQQKMYEEAKEYSEKLLKAYPANRPGRQILTKCQAELKRSKAQERAKYAGMFDKFRKQDEETEIKKKIDQQREKVRAKTLRKEETDVTNGTAEADDATVAS